MDPNISQGISQLGGAMLRLPALQQNAMRQAQAQANADRLYELQLARNDAQVPLIRAQTDWYNARTKNETSKGIAGDLFPGIVNNVFETIPATAGSPEVPAGWAPPSSGWSAPDQPMTSIGAYPGRAAVAAQPARTAITTDQNKLAAFIAGANAAGYNPQTNVNAVRQLLGTQAMTAGTPGNPSVPFQGYQGLGMNLITPGSFDTNTATGVADRDNMIANAHANSLELAKTKGELANAGSLANTKERNEGAMARLVAKGEQVTPGKGPKISFSEDKAAQEKAMILMDRFLTEAVAGADPDDAKEMKDKFTASERGKKISTELSRVIREKFAATKNVVEAEDAGLEYLKSLKNETIGEVSHIFGSNDIYTANKDLSAVGASGTPKISATGSAQTPAEAIVAPVGQQTVTPPTEQNATPVAVPTEDKPKAAEAPVVEKASEPAAPKQETPAEVMAPAASAAAPAQTKQAETQPPAEEPKAAAPAEMPKEEPKQETPAEAVATSPTSANVNGLVNNNPFKGTGTVEEQMPEQIGSPSGAGAASTEKTPFEKKYVELMTRKAKLSRSLVKGKLPPWGTETGIGQAANGTLIDMSKDSRHPAWQKAFPDSPPTYATIGANEATTKELIDIDRQLQKLMTNPFSRISPSAAYLDDLTIHGAGRYYVEDASKLPEEQRKLVIDRKELMFLLQSPTVVRNSDGSPRAVYRTSNGAYLDEGVVFKNFDKHHEKLANYFIQEGLLDMKPGDSLARKLFSLKVEADREILAYNRAKGDNSWLKQMGGSLGLPGLQSLTPGGTGFGQGRNMMRYGSPEYLKQHPIPDVPEQ